MPPPLHTAHRHHGVGADLAVIDLAGPCASAWPPVRRPPDRANLAFSADAEPAHREGAQPDREAAPSRSAVAVIGQADTDGDLAWLWRVLGHAPGARERRTELLRLTAVSADQAVRARVLNTLGRFTREAGDLDASASLHQEALLIARRARDFEATATALDGLAALAVLRGGLELAASLCQESLGIWRARREPPAVARTLAILGWLQAAGGDHAAGRAALDESLAIRRGLAAPGPDLPALNLPDLDPLGLGLLHRGWLAWLDGDRPGAAALLAEALTGSWQHPGRWRLLALLHALARPAGAATLVEHAAGLLAGVETVAAAPPEPDPVRDRLTARALVEAWTDGREHSISSVVEDALRASGSVTRGPAGRRAQPAEDGTLALLTPREREIAGLIGRGYTNRQIAEAVVVTERTAETHTRNIRSKLGFTTRSQVAAWAVGCGLLHEPASDAPAGWPQRNPRLPTLGRPSILEMGRIDAAGGRLSAAAHGQDRIEWRNTR